MTPTPEGGFRAGPCPYETNGELRVWATRSGRLAVMCDECDATWFDPATVSSTDSDTPVPREINPTTNRLVRRLQKWGLLPAPKTEFAFSNGEVLAEPATREQIQAHGWSHLITD